MTVKRELGAYFEFEDIGPPAIFPQPRGGTYTRDPRPPQWGPGADPVLMSVVYKRLQVADRHMSRNIFSVLRARYGIVNQRDRVSVDQAKDPAYATLIDWAEELYWKARGRLPSESRLQVEKRKLEARWDRLFGVEV